MELVLLQSPARTVLMQVFMGQEALPGENRQELYIPQMTILDDNFNCVLLKPPTRRPESTSCFTKEANT